MFNCIDKFKLILSISVVGFLESYGWLLIIGFLVLYFIYNKFINNRSRSLSSSSRSNEIDEERELQRMMKMEEARKRQQEKINEAAAKYLAEKKQVCKVEYFSNIVTLRVNFLKERRAKG